MLFHVALMAEGSNIFKRIGPTRSPALDVSHIVLIEVVLWRIWNRKYIASQAPSPIAHPAGVT